MKNILKIAIPVAALIVISLIWPVHEWVQTLIVWVKGSGAWGVVIYAVIYIIAALLFIPGSLLTLGAGFVYGPFWGTLLVSPTSVMAAFIAFSLARGRLRPWVIKKVGGNPRFKAIDKAVGEQGFKIVTLMRLSPAFPYVFLNYALGLTGVKATHYIFASFIGMLPATFLYTYLGSLVTSITELASATDKGASEAQNIFLWAGFAVTVVVTIYVTTLARRALRETIGQEGSS